MKMLELINKEHHMKIYENKGGYERQWHRYNPNVGFEYCKDLNKMNWVKWSASLQLAEQVIVYDTPYIPKNLSDDEKAVLRSFDCKFNWIARDKNFKLFVYETVPKKYACEFVSGDEYGIECFEHIFQQIQWDNEEATNIRQLLEDNKIEVEADSEENTYTFQEAVGIIEKALESGGKHPKFCRTDTMARGCLLVVNGEVGREAGSLIGSLISKPRATISVEDVKAKYTKVC